MLNEQDRQILVKDYQSQMNELNKQLAQKEKEMVDKDYLNNQTLNSLQDQRHVTEQR